MHAYVDAYIICDVLGACVKTSQIEIPFAMRRMLLKAITTMKVGGETPMKVRAEMGCQS